MKPRLGRDFLSFGFAFKLSASRSACNFSLDVVSSLSLRSLLKEDDENCKGRGRGP